MFNLSDGDTVDLIRKYLSEKVNPVLDDYTFHPTINRKFPERDV